MMCNRLRYERMKAGLNQVELAKIFNVSKQTVSNWESGKRKPDIDTISRLSQFFNVTTDYLLGNDMEETDDDSLDSKGGVNPISNIKKSDIKKVYNAHTYKYISKEEDQKKFEDFLNKYFENKPYIKNNKRLQISDLDDYGASVRKTSPDKGNNLNMVKVPVLDNIVPGQPILNKNNIIDYKYEYQPNLKVTETEFYFKVKSDNMINARIQCGDIVKIKKQNHADNNGDIMGILVDGEFMLQRVYFEKGGLRLMSENPIYPSVFYSREDIENKHISIIGKVIEVTIKF